MDQIPFLVNDLYTYFLIHFAERGAWEWVLFFFPIFIFGELPRYVFPAIALLICRAFGLPKDDENAKRKFIATQPEISVLLVGYNEEDSIEKAIHSLLEFEYPNLEIIVVDDGSTDRMYEKAKPFAEKGLIKLLRNSGATGRAGRPVASNIALYAASHEFILSVDADTSFDRNTLLHMIGPFYDPKVGVVAGNLKVRNFGKSFWTRMQALEYFQSISLWKRWLNLLGCNMQASGAFGGFRRSVLLQGGAWDPELAEDADLSLKIKKGGWKVVFAPDAIAMTSAPQTMKQLMKQRYRWDRGTLRTYFHKHGDLMRFWRFDWRNAFEMAQDYFFSIFLSYVFVFWLAFMLWQYPIHLLFIFPICYAAYTVTSVITLGVPLLFSERRAEEWPMFLWTPLFPFYKAMLRWVRMYALILETLRVNYDESYLPQSACRNAPKW